MVDYVLSLLLSHTWRSFIIIVVNKIDGNMKLIDITDNQTDMNFCVSNVDLNAILVLPTCTNLNFQMQILIKIIIC